MEREPGWTRAALAGDPRGKRAAAALSRAGSRAGAAGPRSGAFVPRAEEVLLKGQLLEGPGGGVPSPPEHPRVAAGDLRRAVPPGCSVCPPLSLQGKLLGRRELGGFQISLCLFGFGRWR